MNVLAIAPHPDDESIGCGGTLVLHARRGDRVLVVFLTSGELGLKNLPRDKAWSIREQEARKAVKILGLRTEPIFLRRPDWLLSDDEKGAALALRPILKEEAPELIYLPHPADWHPDHKAALPVIRAALKSNSRPGPTLRGYEVWTPLTEHDHVENISSVMRRKLRALRAHGSQLKGKYDYVCAVAALNRFRGALAGNCAYAEVFQTLQ